MNTLVVSGLVLLVLLLLAVFWTRGKKGKPLPYDVQETLFSPAERSFLGVLDLAVGDKARVFAKVRVADVLTPEAGMGKSKWQQAFNKISAKHLDYLLCHPADLSFICAIELDDSSHRQQKRRARDSFLKAAFDSAGLPLLQIPASSHYQVEELRELILPLLIKKTAPLADDLMPGERREPTFSPLLLDGVDTEETRHGGRSSSSSSTMSTPVRSALVSATDSELVDNLFAEVDDEEDDHPHQAPHCPRCDAPLVEREAKKGPHAGRLFMACSRFPECRYAAPHTNARH
ncbi:topoisomerase [Aeromonas piscicola]|nr:topoisomerase [Aeromonas piscicola]